MDYRWADRWASAWLRGLRHRTSSTGPSGSAFAIQVLHYSLARSPFALGPSLSPLHHRAGQGLILNPRFEVIGLGTSSRTLRSNSSAGQSAHDRLVFRLRVLVPSHSYRRWLPRQASSSSVVHSSLHSSILVFSACITLDSLDQPSAIA